MSQKVNARIQVRNDETAKGTGARNDSRGGLKRQLSAGVKRTQMLVEVGGKNSGGVNGPRNPSLRRL